MATAMQDVNQATDVTFRTSSLVSSWTELNPNQLTRLWEAVRLWDDVSNQTMRTTTDGPDLARRSTTQIVETFLGVEDNRYWQNSLPHDWTRVAVGEITNPGTLGLNFSYGANLCYHEVIIDLG